MSSPIIELNTEVLERQVESIADYIGDSIKEPLAYRLKLMLKEAPVSITMVDISGAANDIEETLNKRELAAIYSMMHYAAGNQNVKPEEVQARVETRFAVPHVALIPRGKFQLAVEYLLEMHMRFLEEI